MLHTMFDVTLWIGFCAGRALQAKHNTSIILTPSGLILGQQNNNAQITKNPTEIIDSEYNFFLKKILSICQTVVQCEYIFQ